METVSRLLEEKGAEIFRVGPGATALEIAQMLSQRHIGSVVVMEGERILGIVTERDLSTRVMLEKKDPSSTLATEIMSRNLVVVAPATTVREAMAVMTQQRCRHLPVFEGGRMVGLVSIGDCTRWVSRDQQVTIQHLQDYIHNHYPR